MTSFIPPWVPLVLLGLIVLGYRQSNTRLVAPATLTGVALGMFVFSLYGVVSAFGASPLALPAWGAAYAAALAAGLRLIDPRGMDREGRAVRVPGSWVPMGLLLSIFLVKFVLGMAAGLRLPMLHEAWYFVPVSATLGAMSGGFGARALAVYRRAMEPVAA